ncbi:MAG: hypothetical protein ABIG84_07490, partial [archaeon]
MSKRIKHLNRLNSIVLFLFILIAISAFVIGITGNEPVFSEQTSFSLDLDAPLFNYTQTRFNDSGESPQINFSSAENKTIWFILPKNSIITKAEFNLTGIIKPYTRCINNHGDPDYNSCSGITSISDVEIGSLTSNPGTLKMGFTSIYGASNIMTIFLTNSTGDVLWAKDESATPYRTNDGVIGDFVSDSDNEFIVGGSSDGIRAFNSSGILIWNYNVAGEVSSIALGNISGGSKKDLVYGYNNKIWVINSSAYTRCSSISLGQKINSIVVSDINDDSFEEIIAGTDNYQIYAFDTNCQEIWNYSTVNYRVKSIAIGNLSADSGNEIVMGTYDNSSNIGKYYLLNSSGSMIWNTSYSDEIYSVKIGEFDYQMPGPEIIGGGRDDYVHILDKNGNIYWRYLARADVNAFAIDNISEDTGFNTNELVVGTGPNSGSGNYNLLILNFDNFPTNITLDIGNDGTKEWNYTEGDGRLRNSTLANNSELLAAITAYMESNCTGRLCTIPVTFSSDVKGILEVRLNITYTYNATEDINYTDIKYWTRTENIVVNESIIARAKNITFTGPAINITVKYIRINDTAIQCGFDGTNYTNATIGSINYCNISSRNPVFISTPNVNTSRILWDDRMQKEVPVRMYSTVSYFTEGMENYFWRKNITIESNNTYTAQSFVNITANITLNDSSDAVRGNEYLNVTWQGSTCNIIPPSPQSTCDTEPPQTPMACNTSIFYVCKKDTNSNGVFDFIKWIHPILSAIQAVFYQAGGASNLEPILSNANVSPQSATWKSYFNYSIYVNDTENDLVNVSLITYSDLLGAWIYRDSKNITGNGTAWFNLSLEKEMTGTQNRYRFAFQDFNKSWSSPIHKSNFTPNYTGPNVTRHDIIITEISGDNSDAIRDTNNTVLVVRINDTTLNEFINETDVSCTFNITYDGTNYKGGYITKVNETGYCTYSFTPDSTYGIGAQTWMATVDPGYYFAPSPQVNWTLNVIGKLNLTLTEPAQDQVVTRNTQMNMTAHLIDQYGLDINSSSINVSEYNCSWYFNNTFIGTTAMQSGGYCNNTYIPGCIYAQLTNYDVEVKLNYTKNPANYTIMKNASKTQIRLFDTLSITIDSPVNASGYFKGETVTLNSTINDTCGTTSTNSPGISWYKNVDIIRIYINETHGFPQNNTPIIITGSTLETSGADLAGWQVNSTRITGINGTIPNIVFETAAGYLDTTSKIVFLVNLTAYSNNTYYLTHNESQVSGAYTTSYILNGGFEGATLTPWTGDGVIESDGGEQKGNNSLKLSVFSSEEETDTITQAFYPLTTKNIKLWYKQKGKYDTAPNTYVNITIGSYICKLPLVYNTSADYNGSWSTFTCNDTSIIGSENLTITLYTDTITSTVDLYIDHLCPSDDNGNCISEDYGLSPVITTVAREQINTTTTEDTFWTIPLTHSLGTRKITAEATGAYYATSSNTTNIDIYGHSSVSTFGYSSAGCTQKHCFAGSTIDLTCKVIDKNTTSPIYDYNVSFYDGIDLLNANGSFTTPAGIATYS